MNRLIWPLFVGATFFALGAAPKVEPKFSVSESIRQESLTITESSGSSSSSETRSVTVGKMTFHAEVPMALASNLDPSTPISLKVGDFLIGTTLKGDAKYQPGRNQAKLTLHDSPANSTIRTISGTVNLKWTKDKLTVDVESKTGLAAAQYVGNVAGEEKGEITAVIEFAGQKVEANVPFSAKIRRKTAGNANQYGEVVTVDLKGKL